MVFDVKTSLVELLWEKYPEKALRSLSKKKKKDE